MRELLGFIVGNNPIDYSIGAGAITSPWWYFWLHGVNEVVASLTLIGGFILVIIRIMVAIKQWHDSK